MKYGFIRAAACAPDLRIADCQYNAQAILRAMEEAEAQGVELLVLPELCITGVSCGDLFFQPRLLDGAMQALRDIAAATRGKGMLVVAGLPVACQGRLFSCAAAAAEGRILGLVPKSCLSPAEGRQFSPALPGSFLEIDGQNVPFGTDLLLCSRENPDLRIAIEVGGDSDALFPPSARHAAAGATVIACCAAENEEAGRAGERRLKTAEHSARCLCGYVRANAGTGESTTDFVFSGQQLIAENGAILAETPPFSARMAVSDIDVEGLALERRLSGGFPALDSAHWEIPFELGPHDSPLLRCIPRSPFIPSDEHERAQRCDEILTMQAHALRRRFEHSRAETMLVGISGGLDSCLALLASVRAIDLAARPRRDIIAVTMPCFGTTQRTRSNAEELCRLLGVTLRCVDISASVRQHFSDIGHDENDRNVTYENAQARQRTMVLMDIANETNGLVVGTGDLSELALGWATYNGDHMSMYGVNAGIPKTLVRHIVAAFAQSADENLRRVLLDIVDTPVSPELLPAGEDGSIAQKTEDLVGPYELHDFYLYYAVRRGFSPGKILYLAQCAFGQEYSRQTLLHWLKNFYRRFFTQQFKRSCMPDGPKVGPVSLSPRGGWQMPSDACAELWLKELETLC